MTVGEAITALSLHPTTATFYDQKGDVVQEIQGASVALGGRKIHSVMAVTVIPDVAEPLRVLPEDPSVLPCAEKAA